MSLNPTEKSIIVINPLHSILSSNRNPKWTCRHIGITIIDKHNFLYRCNRCCEYGNIRVIPNNKTIMDATKKD